MVITSFGKLVYFFNCIYYTIIQTICVDYLILFADHFKLAFLSSSFIFRLEFHFCCLAEIFTFLPEGPTTLPATLHLHACQQVCRSTQIDSLPSIFIVRQFYPERSLYKNLVRQFTPLKKTGDNAPVARIGYPATATGATWFLVFCAYTFSAAFSASTV